MGGLLLVGANPLDAKDADGEVAMAATVAANSAFALAAILKGRVVLGVVGVFVPLVALVAALRLARPGSAWACRWYRAGSRKLARSRQRFPAGRRSRLDRLVDLFAAPPPGLSPAAAVDRAGPAPPVPRVGRESG